MEFKYSSILPNFQEDLFLFHTDEYWQNGDSHFVSLINEQELNSIVVSFRCKDDEWISLPNATFGGTLCLSSITENEIVYFIQALKKWAQGKYLIIKQIPDCYLPLASQWHRIFLNEGFHHLLTETNQFILVQDTDNFTLRWHDSLKRNFKKAQTEGFVSCVIDAPTPAQRSEYFTLLLKHRAYKGFPVTLTQDQFDRLFEYKNKYLIFEVRDNEKVIAFAIGVILRSDILYYFQPAHDPEYDAYSPMLMVLQMMYDYAQKNKMKYLDLGISSVNGVLNKGLFTFKSRLGALSCPKYYYEYEGNEK